MDDLQSLIPALLAAVAIVIALPLTLGLAMHFQTRFPRMAMPALAALIAIVPPAGQFLNGRNLSVKNLNFLTEIDAGGLAAWVYRLSSASAIFLSLTVIVVCQFEKRDFPQAGRAVFYAFLIYFASNILLNGAFGTIPRFNSAHAYGVLLLTALFLVRYHGPTAVMGAFKWGLFLMMVGSFAMMAVKPTLVLQTNTPEVHLPFVNFRFWGLGDGPNSTGPLALILVLLTFYQPFKWRIISLLSISFGLAALLLAQSRTTWMAAAIILPPFLVYRYLTHPSKGESRKISLMAGLAISSLCLAFIVAGAVIALDLNEVSRGISELIGVASGQSGAALSGRGAIWAVALQTFQDNVLFGYGITAWDLTFRARIGMPFAFHAHNQFFQSMSVAGLIGLLGMMTYLGVMLWQSIKLARVTRGLAPALVVLLFVRSISESPINLETILSGDFLMQAILYFLLTSSAYQLVADRHKARVGATTASMPPDPVRNKQSAFPSSHWPSMAQTALPSTPNLLANNQNESANPPRHAESPDKTEPADAGTPQQEPAKPKKPVASRNKVRSAPSENVGRVEPRLDL